jgi:hypothetical protein
VLRLVNKVSPKVEGSIDAVRRKYCHLERYKLDHHCAHGGGRIWDPRRGAEVHLCGERIVDGISVNWKLVSHPINWLVILLMLVIAGTAGHLLLSLAGIEAATNNINPNLAVGQSSIGA